MSAGCDSRLMFVTCWSSDARGLAPVALSARGLQQGRAGRFEILIQGHIYATLARALPSFFLAVVTHKCSGRIPILIHITIIIATITTPPPCNSGIIGLSEDPNISIIIPYSHYYSAWGPPEPQTLTTTVLYCCCATITTTTTTTTTTTCDVI